MIRHKGTTESDIALRQIVMKNEIQNMKYKKLVNVCKGYPKFV